MNLPSILLWGFAATIVLTALTIAAQSLGLTRIDIPFILGTMFTADRDRAKFIGLSWEHFLSARKQISRCLSCSKAITTILIAASPEWMAKSNWWHV